MLSVWLRKVVFCLLRVSGCDCWSGEVECPTEPWNNCFDAETFKAHRHSTSFPSRIWEVPCGSFFMFQVRFLHN